MQPPNQNYHSQGAQVCKLRQAVQAQSVRPVPKPDVLRAKQKVCKGRRVFPPLGSGNNPGPGGRKGEGVGGEGEGWHGR